MDYLPCEEIDSSENAKASIIWLHGLGADGHDFVPIIPELHLPEAMHLRFILPHAPSIAVSINGGQVMPAWFDFLQPGGKRSINAAQLLGSATAIHKLIDREIDRGVDSKNILLVGFSQGGAVCLQAGLTYDKPLAGILGLSTFFPTAEVITPHPASHGLPIQIFHGLEDQVLPISMAENSVKALRVLGYQPDYKTYQMQHSVCQEEIEDISTWIQNVLI
jgi:phospholipase/carboxylesterase